MKKFTNLKWLSDSLANAGRFIYFSRGGDAPQDDVVAPQTETLPDTETPPTPEEVHDQNLDALRTAQDQGELAVAAALETALDSLGTQYEGKAQDSISNGQQELRDLLTSMGVEEKEMEDILGQYGTVFKDTIYTLGGKNERLQTANERQKDEISKALKTTAKFEVDAKYRDLQREAQGAITNSKTQMDRCGSVISQRTGEKTQLEGDLRTANSSLKSVAKEYELPATDYDTISTMEDTEIFEKVYAHMVKENPNWEVDFPDAQQRSEMCRRRIDTFIKPAIDKIKTIKENIGLVQSDITRTKEVLQLWTEENQRARKIPGELSAQKIAEEKMIDKGEYVLKNGETINACAQRNAEDPLNDSQEEREIHEEYAAKAQEKIGELARAIMVRRLDARIIEIENILDGEGGLVAQIEQRQDELQQDIDAKNGELKTQVSNFNLDSRALFAATDTAGYKRAIEEGVRAQYTDAQLLDFSVTYGVRTADEAVKVMVDNRYQVFKSKMDGYHTAQAQLQSDPEIKNLRGKEMTARTTLADLQSKKDTYNS